MEVKMKEIPVELYNKLEKLGMIPNEVREGNVGKSNYSEYLIQPWSIWIDYKLNPWDADLVKRILRTKEEAGMTLRESRLMDYKKMIHICKERIRQLELEQEPCLIIKEGDLQNSAIILNEDYYASCLTFDELPIFSLRGTELASYESFKTVHSVCGNEPIQTKFEPTPIGNKITVICPNCHCEQEITDYSTW